jgi:hypothetical protein
MKTILRIATGLFLISSAVFGLSGRRDDPILWISGSAVQDGLSTKYSIAFRNMSREQVTDICVKEAGVAIHSRTFSPGFLLPAIAPGRTHTLNVWIRGNISPIPEACQIGVRATYRVGSRTYYTFLPAWDRSRPLPG